MNSAKNWNGGGKSKTNRTETPQQAANEAGERQVVGCMEKLERYVLKKKDNCPSLLLRGRDEFAGTGFAEKRIERKLI